MDPRSPLSQNPRKRVPPLTRVPGVNPTPAVTTPPASTPPAGLGPNPLARTGFKAWFDQRTQDRGITRPFKQMSDERQSRLRQRYNATRPDYNQPVTSNGSFFDPNSGYGYNGAAGNIATSPIGDIFLEDNPDAAWMRHLAGLGIDPMSPEGQWARSQLGNVKTGWNAALATNPQLRQRDYLQSLDIRNMFRNLSAGERGERPGMFAPRARTISRGYG